MKSLPVRLLGMLCLCTPVILVLYYSSNRRTHNYIRDHHTTVAKIVNTNVNRRDALLPLSVKNKVVKSYKRLEYQRNSTATSSPESFQVCDSECQRFKTLMASWDTSSENRGKPKSVIYILTSGRRTLFECIKSIDIYFNKQFKYPVIIFHENNLIEQIDEIRQSSISNLFFQQIEFRLPSFLKKENIVENIPCTSEIGYRHMCRFQAKGVYEQPIMADLDYHWRLDDDSLLLRPIKYDVFKFMRDNGYLYGYVWKHWDSLLCTTGLWPATSRFIKERKIKPTFFEDWPMARLFYNNFEISATSLWFSKQYKRYIDFIDKLGGIYYFRWGDAPIKGLALSLFVPLNQTYYFEDVGYRHGSFVLNNTIQR